MSETQFQKGIQALQEFLKRERSQPWIETTITKPKITRLSTINLIIQINPSAATSPFLFFIFNKNYWFLSKFILC